MQETIYTRMKYFLTLMLTSFMSWFFVSSHIINEICGCLDNRTIHSEHEDLIGTTSFGISYQLKDIYSICRCCLNVATYKWKVHNGKIEIIFLFVNYCQFRDVGQVMKQTYLYLYKCYWTKGSSLLSWSHHFESFTKFYLVDRYEISV
jgi:hypothetical protein